VLFHCDVNFDPFTYLRENNKTYGSFLSCITHQTFSPTSLNSGFTLSVYDYRPALPFIALFDATYSGCALMKSLRGVEGGASESECEKGTSDKPFTAGHNGFVSDDGGADYNLCVCTSSSFPT
jgi:hypothetical protein